MKIKPNLYTLLIIMLLSSLINSPILAEENPLTLIKNVSSVMIDQLTLKQKDIANDSTVVMDIVEQILIPHFASNTIARKVLGKHARTITDEQQQQFADAFRYYMIRFYSKAFASYTNQSFEYLEAPEFIDEKRVTVKTLLIQPAAQSVAIDYKMQRSGDSWKIIDIYIEGISLVISNRSQFGPQISRDGIETVIAKLDYKNKKAQTND